MSQHDFNIDNQTAPAFRSDLNSALEALGTLSSGATAPSTTFANMLWYDTAANILKMRSEADDAWINVGYLCQSTNKFCILDDTNVVTTGGTQAGLLGDQATSAWEAGTSTTESLVSPAKVKAAIVENAPVYGMGQTWQDVASSRSSGVSYQNTTGQTIVVATQNNGGQMQASHDNSTWVGLVNCRNFGETIVVPPNYYYRFTGSGIALWVELR